MLDSRLQYQITSRRYISGVLGMVLVTLNEMSLGN